MRLLTIIIAIIFLTACSEKEHLGIGSRQMEKPAEATKPMAQALTAVEMLEAFKKDISVCKSVVRLLKDYRSFIKIDYSTPQPIPLEVFLRHPQYANSTEFKHILLNQQYFLIDKANMEIGNPWAVAWVDDGDGIFCQVTIQRLDEIEALGESQEAWNIREYFLDKTLYGLVPVSSLMVDSYVDFMGLKSLVMEASNRYVLTQRPKFIAWTKKAIEVIEKSRSTIQKDDVVTPVEQNNVIDERISFLRSFAAHGQQ